MEERKICMLLLWSPCTAAFPEVFRQSAEAGMGEPQSHSCFILQEAAEQRALFCSMQIPHFSMLLGNRGDRTAGNEIRAGKEKPVLAQLGFQYSCFLQCGAGAALRLHLHLDQQGKQQKQEESGGVVSREVMLFLASAFTPHLCFPHLPTSPCFSHYLPPCCFPTATTEEKNLRQLPIIRF